MTAVSGRKWVNPRSSPHIPISEPFHEHACPWSSTQFVKGSDLEVERFVSRAPTPIRGDGHTMDLTAKALNFDRSRIGGRIGVDLETPELAGRLAAE
jgi:hypothetical protein